MAAYVLLSSTSPFMPAYTGTRNFSPFGLPQPSFTSMALPIMLDMGRPPRHSAAHLSRGLGRFRSLRCQGATTVSSIDGNNARCFGSCFKTSWNCWRCKVPRRPLQKYADTTIDNFHTVPRVSICVFRRECPKYPVESNQRYRTAAEE
jgi:hypothetical protein